MKYLITELEERFALCCPACKQALDRDAMRCRGCSRPFRYVNNVPSFVDEEMRRSIERDFNSNRENAFLKFFKQWPRLYSILYFIVVPVYFTGLTGKRFFARRNKGERMLNVGSGASLLHPDVLNVDMFPFEHVHVIAHAERLPFPDDTFDAVCAEQMLEHVPNPKAVAAEMLRVTKPGGHIYAAVPFMYPLHPSPKDYSRWSADGLAMLFAGHEAVESGVLVGPVSGMASVLASGLSVILSFGITPLRKALHYLFMVLLNPLKYLDILYARLPGAADTAADVYVVVQK
jgi:SAM-dependent methyltransferase